MVPVMPGSGVGVVPVIPGSGVGDAPVMRLSLRVGSARWVVGCGRWWGGGRWWWAAIGGGVVVSGGWWRPRTSPGRQNATLVPTWDTKVTPKRLPSSAREQDARASCFGSILDPLWTHFGPPPRRPGSQKVSPVPTQDKKSTVCADFSATSVTKNGPAEAQDGSSDNKKVSLKGPDRDGTCTPKNNDFQSAHPGPVAPKMAPTTEPKVIQNGPSIDSGWKRWHSWSRQFSPADRG